MQKSTRKDGTYTERESESDSERATSEAELTILTRFGLALSSGYQPPTAACRASSTFSEATPNEIGPASHSFNADTIECTSLVVRPFCRNSHALKTTSLGRLRTPSSHFSFRCTVCVMRRFQSDNGSPWFEYKVLNNSTCWRHADSSISKPGFTLRRFPNMSNMKRLLPESLHRVGI